MLKSARAKIALRPGAATSDKQLAAREAPAGAVRTGRPTSIVSRTPSHREAQSDLVRINYHEAHPRSIRARSSQSRDSHGGDIVRRAGRRLNDPSSSRAACQTPFRRAMTGRLVVESVLAWTLRPTAGGQLAAPSAVLPGPRANALVQRLAARPEQRARSGQAEAWAVPPRAGLAALAARPLAGVSWAVK